MFACIEADFHREYNIDLLTSDMSWRKFQVLYYGLSPRSAVYRNYAKIAKKEGVKSEAVEKNAWDTFTHLSKPKG